MHKKVNERVVSFLVFYIDDILLVGNDILVFQFINIWLLIKISMKYLEEESILIDPRDYWNSFGTYTLTKCWSCLTHKEPRED